MAATISVTVRQVREDGTEGPLEEELAATLAGPVEQFTSMRHRRERPRPGRDRHLRAGPGHPAYRNRREANLYPADAKWILPDDPYTLGMRP
jgi:hypothetical protein